MTVSFSQARRCSCETAVTRAPAAFPIRASPVQRCSWRGHGARTGAPTFAATGCNGRTFLALKRRDDQIGHAPYAADAAGIVDVIGVTP